jgi:hypothetical protein
MKNIIIAVCGILLSIYSSFSQTNNTYEECVYNTLNALTPIKVCVDTTEYKAIIWNRDLLDLLLDMNVLENQSRLTYLINLKSQNKCIEMNTSGLKKYKCSIVMPNLEIDTININTLDILIDKYFTSSKDTNNHQVVRTYYRSKSNITHDTLISIVSKLNDYRVLCIYYEKFGVYVNGIDLPKEVMEKLARKKEKK